MESNRFFRVVWRINAIVILLAGLLAVGALAAVVAGMAWDAARSSRAPNVADQINVAPGDALADAEPDLVRASIGQFENIAGSTSLRAAVHVAGGSTDYSSKGDASTRNYLYFDTATGTSHWLMPDNKTEFLTERDFPEHSGGADEARRPVLATLYQLRTQAPRGAARNDRHDQQTLAVSDPNGRHFRVLVDGIDEVNALWLDDARHIAALYSIGATLYTLKLDLGAGPGAAPVVTKVNIARP